MHSNKIISNSKILKQFFLFALGLIFCHPTENRNSISDKILHDARARAVTIYYDTDLAKGSGFFINSRGLILTAYHVIGSEKIIRISQNGKDFFSASPVYIEPIFDLALMKSDLALGIEILEWKDRPNLSINQNVFSFCSPLDLPETFLRGYISNLDRTGYDPQFPLIPYIQTYGTSFQGSSGSAVYLETGEIIGITRSTFGNTFGNSFGFVIPSGYIKVFLDKAEESGINLKQ